MPQYGNPVVDQLIVPAALWFFFIGGVAASAVGAGLIFRSAAVFRLFGVMNRSVSTRHLSKPLAIPRDSDRLAWQWRRPLAVFFVVGAVFALYGLVTRVDDAALVVALKLDYPPAVVLWAVQSARLLLVAGCAAALAVGVLLGFFPQAMRVIEAYASRWVSTRQMAPDADRMIMSLDDWVAASPRAAGWTLLLPALGMVFYFGVLLLH
jgi:hypothetical protein